MKCLYPELCLVLSLEVLIYAFLHILHTYYMGHIFSFLIGNVDVVGFISVYRSRRLRPST